MIKPSDCVVADVNGPSSCMTAGVGAESLIRTPDGDCRAGDLIPGQWVTTRRGPRCIESISHTRAVAGQPLILVTAGALCAGPSAECLFLTGQRVLIHDWRARVMYRRSAATPRLSQLEDGEFVRVTDRAGAAFVSLCLGRPEIVFCNGLAVVSADATSRPHLPADRAPVALPPI